MSLRHFASVVLVILVSASSLFAIDLGKAEGTVTINGEPVAMKYAFAMKEKDYEEKDQWVVMLTDRAVSRSLLGDSSRFSKAVENGELVAVAIRFNEAKELQQAEIRSNAVKHKTLPVMPSDVTLTGFALTADSVEGAAATSEEQDFFDDIGSFDVKFRAPLGKDGKYGDNAAAAKELAGSRPRLADGKASGTLVIDGKSVKLEHAIARTKPNSFDEKKTDVVVLLTEKAVPAETFVETQQLFEGVSNGSVQGLLVTIDSDEKPYHVQFLHPSTNMQLSGSGIFEFDPTDFSDTHVSARFFTSSEQSFMGEEKYTYDVSFAVPVQKIVAPSEVTVDASSGTPLPAGGGDPGKAYLAFDKAARAGNLEGMKKYGSKDRPIPEMSAEEMKQMLELMKMMRAAKVTIRGGFVSGDHATLNVDGEDPSDKSKMRGTIEMTKEDGGWKILAEKWRIGE